MSRFRRFKDTDLFIIRMWAEEVGDEEMGDGAGRRPTELRGKVQRVVDGESHQFDSWQALVELLQAMVSERGDTRMWSRRPEEETKPAHDQDLQREMR